ncbi:MAG TPA: hypothetical protein ENI07_02150 [Desulfobacterales bacterium]|nr:hypothetical protein [Desulfobacterales bacterium]
MTTKKVDVHNLEKISLLTPEMRTLLVQKAGVDSIEMLISVSNDSVGKSDLMKLFGIEHDEMERIVEEAKSLLSKEEVTRLSSKWDLPYYGMPPYAYMTKFGGSAHFVVFKKAGLRLLAKALRHQRSNWVAALIGLLIGVLIWFGATRTNINTKFVANLPDSQPASHDAQKQDEALLKNGLKPFPEIIYFKKNALDSMDEFQEEKPIDFESDRMKRLSFREQLMAIKAKLEEAFEILFSS